MKAFFVTKMTRDQRGASTLKGVVILVAIVALIPLLIVGFYEGRKAYWDAQVREMCAKDGGNSVFEKAAIAPEQLRDWGGVGGVLGLPNESDQATKIPFFRRTKDQVVHAGSPLVMRLETEFVRRSDSKLLARSVSYYRRGGDFPTWGHESTYGCTTDSKPIETEIFILRDEQK
jgi:hypothetical protein